MRDRIIGGLDLASLRSRPRQRFAGRDGLVASPCGRNVVWQIDLSAGGQLFVTCCRDAADFTRRLFGLTVALELAGSDDRFMAAAIEFADVETNTIVTRHIGGTSVADLFARAFRLDQNPFDVWNRRARARDCVELALEWLSAFRQVKAIRPEALYDHSPSASWARSCRRLASDAFSDFRHLQAVSSTYALQLGSNDGLLVMGDATLGNFYVDGRQIGAVDFEDVGVGAGWRDDAHLAAAIEWTLRHPLYAADGELESRLASRRTSLHALTELELLVNRFIAARTVARTRTLRRIGDAIDRRLAELVTSGHVIGPNHAPPRRDLI